MATIATSLITIVCGLGGTLALVTHLTPERIASDADPNAIPRLTTWQPLTADPSGPSKLPPFAAGASVKADRTDHATLPSSVPSDPYEVLIGPPGISGRFTVLSTDRKPTTPTADELTVRIRVVSLAAADLVTPFGSAMLDVRSQGNEPIQPERTFSHPVPAGTRWDEDIAFAIPPSLDTADISLHIHYHAEAKEIPFNLPPRRDPRRH